jgi:hypothetical protein
MFPSASNINSHKRDGWLLGDWISSCDMYHQLYSHDLQPKGTVAGGLSTIIALIVSVYLVVSEVSVFLQIDVISRTYVDKGWDAVQVYAPTMDLNMDISLHSLPCSVASLDISDSLGNHFIDVQQDLQKEPIDSSKGCRFVGRIAVRKVPGDVHISAHAHIDALKSMGVDELRLNLSHEIHSFYFGSEAVSEFHISDSSFSLLKGVSRVLSDSVLSGTIDEFSLMF